jgi:hypothetical protein
MELAKLPVAEGASFDSHAEEHNPLCLEDTRVDLLHEITKWAEDPGAKAMYVLVKWYGWDRKIDSFMNLGAPVLRKGHSCCQLLFQKRRK